MAKKVEFPKEIKTLKRVFEFEKGEVYFKSNGDMLNAWVELVAAIVLREQQFKICDEIDPLTVSITVAEGQSLTPEILVGEKIKPMQVTLIAKFFELHACMTIEADILNQQSELVQKIREKQAEAEAGDEAKGKILRLSDKIIEPVV